MARNLAAAPTKQTPGENSGKVVLPEKSTLYSPKDAILTPEIGFSVTPLFHFELAKDGKPRSIFLCLVVRDLVLFLSRYSN